jgi:hypothetical protein
LVPLSVIIMGLISSHTMNSSEMVSGAEVGVSKAESDEKERFILEERTKRRASDAYTMREKALTAQIQNMDYELESRASDGYFNCTFEVSLYQMEEVIKWLKELGYKVEPPEHARMDSSRRTIKISWD